MKMSRYLFTVFVLGLLTLDSSYAGEEAKLPRPANFPTQNASGNELHPPALKRATSPPANELIMKNKGNNGSISTTPRLLRNPNATASLGGLTAASAKSSPASLGGPATRRKP
jgi:hypothetical protein